MLVPRKSVSGSRLVAGKGRKSYLVMEDPYGVPRWFGWVSVLDGILGMGLVALLSLVRIVPGKNGQCSIVHGLIDGC